MNNISNIEKSEYSNQVLNFIETLKKDKLIDLKILFDNLSSLRIKTVNNITNYNIFSKSKINAYYEGLNNTITISKKTVDASLYHELFHVASSYNTRDKLFSGLSQLSNKNLPHIGRFLNEGYTELLVHRYFDTEENNSYVFGQNVSSIIEEIIGREKMYACYFKADLNELIKCLSKYAAEKDIIRFLSKDCNSDFNYDIVSFLRYIYFEKLKQDFDIKLISKDELLSKIINYVQKIEKYDIDEELEEFFGDEIFSNSKKLKK